MVTDLVVKVQQAILQVLTPVYERLFSDNSFGYRPKRSAHKALYRCKKFISEGYTYAIDMDMEKFFDTVNHSKLIEILSKMVDDNRVLSLIHKYRNAGVVVEHKFDATEEGVLQRGPLSPLLSNIMLNELDKELTKRDHPFVRYADIKSLLNRIDEWYRRRLRMVIWKQWKRIRTRYRNLIKLGIPKGQAWEWANIHKSYWRISNSYILSRSITNNNLTLARFLFFSDYYLKMRVG